MERNVHDMKKRNKGGKDMKSLCAILGHKRRDVNPNEVERDMFGCAYIWQPKYCKRCGKRLVR